MIDPVTRTLLLRKVRTATSDLSAYAREAFGRDRGRVSCGAGCAFCCYAKVLTDISEGLAIYLWLLQERRWSTQLQAKLLADDREVAVVPHDGWMQRRKPCSFLEEEAFGKGECSIYPVRPSGCALAFSSERPEACADPFGSFFGVVTSDALLLDLFRARDLVVQVAGAPRFVMGTLPGMVLVAHAVVAGLPLPPVLLVSMADYAGEDLKMVFDAQAGAFYEKGEST